MVPPDIDIASRDGPDSCTISGPAESIKELVVCIQKKGISVSEVKVSNIACHSRYVAEAGPKLLTYLNETLPEGKLRSQKWICSSCLECDWDKDHVRYAAAEYFTNNLLNPVYFEEACKHIPKNAITIEIAPHGLLQAILKRSLAKDVVNIPLTLRDHQDNAEFLLCALGKIYEAGVNPQLHKLYPPIEYPVSRGTPMLSPLIKWEHSEDWFVASGETQDKSGERRVIFTLKDDELEYLSGHVVDGRNLYPATGYLILAWETVSLMRGEALAEVPVVFENVRFERATNIPKEGYIEFTVMVQKGSGNFEVVEGGVSIVSGRIYVPEDIEKECANMPPLEETESDPDLLPLNSRDVYKELRIRGYHYKGLFKGITYVNNKGNVGRVSWVNNFVAFMDALLQMQILQEDTRGLFIPTSIQRMVINTKKHLKVLSTLDPKKPEFPVFVYNEIDLIQCGGIEIRNVKANVIARKKPRKPVLEKFLFVPNESVETNYNIEEVIRICTHICLENMPALNVKTIELLDSFANVEGPLISEIVVRVLGDLPLIQADVVVLAKNKHPLITEELEGITVEDKKLPADQSALIVITSHMLNRKDALRSALNSMKDRGFLLTREKTTEDLPFAALGLDVCFDHIMNNERVLLLRKTVEVGIEPVMIKITGDAFSWVPEVQKSLSSLNTAQKQKLVIYAEKEKQNGILGFFNSIRRENFGGRIRCFFIMDESAPTFSLQHPLYKAQYAKDLALNVYKDGIWGSYRHLLLENVDNVDTHHAYVNTLVRGDLSTLRWIEGPINLDTYVPTPNDMLVHVYYASLNFRDIMLATGRLPVEVTIRNRWDQECVLGVEYAGKGDNGERYMGMIFAKTMSTLISSDVDLMWRVPDEWTLEEAATVPVAYGTALYALLHYGQMKRGESVLIHAGSGGVGQAAINVCLHYGCEIFTTVGTQEKRDFIRKHFPSIPESHIGNSRDTSFELMVKRETSGRGVDLVLNSLAEEKLQASVRCLAQGGRFLEIGKFDLAKNNSLGMRHFLKEISFRGVMLDNLLSAEKKMKVELHQILADAIRDGFVRPTVRAVFKSDELEKAFRYMAAGKHIGKVMLKLRDEEPDKRAKPNVIRMKAVPRYLCTAEKSYIIIGGLGGFGLELADWLVLRGARNLVLTSRKGVTTGYQAMRIRIWRSYGTKVVISTDNITEKIGVGNLIKTANSMGAVSAIFNLAVVLQDDVFENQTEETFANSYGPKAMAAMHLDELSRQMCPELDQFVMFSSMTCGRGNAGQTNYGLSNSVMERICETRRTNNLPALAIQWGAVGEVGLVVDNMAEDDSEKVIGGVLQQRISSCLEVMDYFLKQSNPIVASMVVAEKRSGGRGGGSIVERVTNILGLRNLKTVSLHSTLPELGMDSMTGVEIKQTLERELGIFLTPQDIRSMTFAKLYEYQAASGNSGAENESDMAAQSDLGLQYLITVVGDEAETSKPIVRIPSLMNEGDTTEVTVSKNPTIFILPGIEGVAKVMEPLGANLAVQALCLQYSYENPPETIAELAKILLVHITNRLPINEEFHIIGFSFGGIVAMEIVKLLESEGRTGRLWLIDSSPTFVKTTAKMTLMNPEQTEDEKQVKMLCRICDLKCPQETKKLSKDLFKLKDWNSRLDKAISLMPPEVRHSQQYLRTIITAAYYRVKSAIYYDHEVFAEGSLNAMTTLIRPHEIFIPTADDYELSKYFKNPVKVHFVEGNHFTILENEKMAELIMDGTIFKEKAQLDNVS